MSFDMQPKEGLISLDVFVEALQNLNGMLDDLKPSRNEDLKWNVTELAVGSVYAVVEPVGNPRAARSVADLAMKGLECLENQQEPPSEFRNALTAVRNLASLVRRTGMRLVVGTLDRTQAITERTLEMAERLLTENYYEAYGSAEGFLEMVTVRNTYQCNIYDTLTDERIECHYTPEMLDEIKNAFGRRVIASGYVRHDSHSNIKSIRIERILPLPDDSELPSIDRMAGIAPNITGGLDVKQYVRRLRDEQ
jgi:hypothetical protein